MNETAKTYINVAVLLLAAVILGCLLGDSIRYMLGTNEETLSSTVFNDRMSVAKQVFTEQNEAYQLVCENVVRSAAGDFRVLRTKDGNLAVLSGGIVTEPSAFFDADTAEAVDRLFFEETDAAKKATDYAEEPITDMALSMMTYEGGQVRWYLYSSRHGYIGIIYADKATIEAGGDIVKLSTDEQYDDGWGIFYSFK